MAARIPPHNPPFTINGDLCAECQPKVHAMMEWFKRHMAFRLFPPRTAEEPITSPEDTLRAAGVSTKRQAKYQRRMSSLLAGRS